MAITGSGCPPANVRKMEAVLEGQPLDKLCGGGRGGRGSIGGIIGLGDDDRVPLGSALPTKNYGGVVEVPTRN